MRNFFKGLSGQALVAVGLLLGTIFAAPVVAQGIIGIFQNGVATGPSVRGTSDATSGLYFGTGFTGVTKHLATSTASAPTLSTCGTSPALGTGSSDMAGKITVGTTASNACTLGFGTAYTTAPFCIVQNATTGAGAFSASVSTTNIVLGGTLADGSELYYNCIAASGG